MYIKRTKVLTIELQKICYPKCCFLKMTIIKILLSMIFEIEIGYILLRLFTEKTQNNIFQGQQ